jgi:NADH-quinone oxidoreductase subunit L
MILLVIGAISKAGSMPFHSWIPDAAIDAPLPFMAFLPASLEKLLGIYFLARISMDLFQFTPESWISPLMMVVGAVTILLAVMMALVQKDYKRLLSYHAISQVGYMILGIGTALPIGIVGGLFHMINNAMYKSCLFLTAGAVEKQTGTTDLAKLGGLGTKMPVTFACYLVTAASISGVPPFNGFFSKEMVSDAALERNVVFFLAAILGSFFTAASFLKLGHAAFLGKCRESNEKVKEAPVSMLAPMVVIAALCVVFGIYNALPLNVFIQPGLGGKIASLPSFAGFPTNTFLIAMTVVALGGALVNHMLGARMAGSGLHAADHIRYAPGIASVYDGAEKRYFDPYDLGMKFAGWVALAGWGVDKAVNWLSDVLVVKVAYGVGKGVRLAHTGSYSLYVLWALAGALAIVLFLVNSV